MHLLPFLVTEIVPRYASPLPVIHSTSRGKERGFDSENGRQLSLEFTVRKLTHTIKQSFLNDHLNLCHCDGLSTSPGWILPLIHGLLEIAPPKKNTYMPILKILNIKFTLICIITPCGYCFSTTAEANIYSLPYFYSGYRANPSQR